MSTKDTDRIRILYFIIYIYTISDLNSHNKYLIYITPNLYIYIVKDDFVLLLLSKIKFRPTVLDVSRAKLLDVFTLVVSLSH